VNGNIHDTWKSVMAELASEIFFGPYIHKHGSSCAFSANLKHTGFRLEVATASKKIDVPILYHRQSVWWRASDYLIPLDGVEFSFGCYPSHHRNVDGIPVLGFFHVLNTILGHRNAKTSEVLSVLGALEPLLEHSGGTPLKKNALLTLIPQYSGVGFATSLVARFVWIYPKFRGTKSVSNYLPVGTAKFPLAADGRFEKGRIEFPWYNETACQLKRFFTARHVQNAAEAFSPDGLTELQLPIRSRQAGGHERTKLMTRRLQIVREMKRTGQTPTAIVIRLRDDGLYSRRVPMSQQVSQVQSWLTSDVRK
jgi:hypothetical protein